MIAPAVPLTKLAKMGVCCLVLRAPKGSQMDFCVGFARTQIWSCRGSSVPALGVLQEWVWVSFGGSCLGARGGHGKRQTTETSMKACWCHEQESRCCVPHSTGSSRSCMTEDLRYKDMFRLARMIMTWASPRERTSTTSAAMWLRSWGPLSEQLFVDNVSSLS